MFYRINVYNLLCLLLISLLYFCGCDNRQASTSGKSTTKPSANTKHTDTRSMTPAQSGSRHLKADHFTPQTSRGIKICKKVKRLDERKRVALVIGNSAYAIGQLRNPRNDAHDMARLLGELGFAVTMLTDARREEMFQVVRDFGAQLANGGVALFYYAGHGVQVDGINYLIPVDADIHMEHEVKEKAIRVDSVLATMAQVDGGLNMVFLDACRNNPFAKRFSPKQRSGGMRGLAHMEAPTGSLIAYATGPGKEAADGDGRNGTFTGYLLKHMRRPNIEVGMMLRYVRVDVEKATNNQQTPWESLSLKGVFYFHPDDTGTEENIANKEKELAKYESMLKDQEQQKRVEEEQLRQKAKEIEQQIAAAKKKLRLSGSDGGGLKVLRRVLAERRAADERLQQLKKEREAMEARRIAEITRLKQERIDAVKKRGNAAVADYNAIINDKYCDVDMKKQAWRELLKVFPDWWQVKTIPAYDTKQLLIPAEERIYFKMLAQVKQTLPGGKVRIYVTWKIISAPDDAAMRIKISGSGIETYEKSSSVVKGINRVYCDVTAVKTGALMATVQVSVGEVSSDKQVHFQITESAMPGFTCLRTKTYSCGGQSHTVKEYLHKKTGLEFVRIPSGSFDMGSDDGDSDEKPVHRVTLDSFLMSKTEVTQGIWQKIIGNNPSSFKKGDEYPVENVSWNDCQEFCRKVGLQLPTEAQWEYACRAGTTTKYYWGNSMSSDYCWYSSNSNSSTQSVKQKQPNAYGLYDMSGNVWEWCQDWKGDYKSSPQVNPTGPSKGSSRVRRGGCLGRSAVSIRSASRDYRSPGYRYRILGFRVVSPVP